MPASRHSDKHELTLITAAMLRLTLDPNHDRSRGLRPGAGLAEAKGVLLGARDAGLDLKLIYEETVKRMKVHHPGAPIPDLETLLEE